MSFALPELPYASDALEPSIDRMTMEIHHGKHHAAYVGNLNKALESASELGGKGLEQLLAGECSTVPAGIRTAVRNNGGGHFNHTLFWKLMTPVSTGAPVGNLSDAIRSTFGSLDAFKERLQAAGMGRFGSGWAWLVKTGSGSLEVLSTPNQDSPVMFGQTPILGVDVWEHAYYLKYQNRRADYLNAWWNVVNWHYAEELFNA